MTAAVLSDAAAAAARRVGAQITAAGMPSDAATPIGLITGVVQSVSGTTARVLSQGRDLHAIMLAPVAFGDTVWCIRSGDVTVILGGDGGASRIVAHAQNASLSQSGITTVTDVTGLALNFTSSGNKYRIRARVHVTGTVANDRVAFTMTDNAGTLIDGEYQYIDSTAAGENVPFEWVDVIPAGDVVRKMRIARDVGTGTLSTASAASLMAYMYAEDVGPA